LSHYFPKVLPMFINLTDPNRICDFFKKRLGIPEHS